MSVREDIEGLCRWEHRGSTTKNERQAAEFIRDRMKTIGLEPDLEEFDSPTSWSWSYMLIAGTLLLALLFAGVLPLVAVVLAALAVVGNYGEHTTRLPSPGRVLPKHPSQNVLGMLRRDKPRGRVVVSAHYDSSRTGQMYHPSMVRHFRLSFVAGQIVLHATAFLVLVRAFGGSGWLLTLLGWVAALYLLFTIGLMVDRELRGRYTQGANDNATGVAAMLRLAERFKEDPPASFDLLFLATGCEEAGMEGMKDFWRKHQFEFDPASTYFVNIDSIGKGRLKFCTGEGMIRFYPYSPTLLYHARKMAQSPPFDDVEPETFTRAYFDNLVPASRGYEAISLISLDEENLIPNWHWHTDTLENVDFDLVEKGADFAEELVRRLDRDLA